MATETLEQLNHITKIVMSLYHDMRKNITMLGKNDDLLSQNIRKSCYSLQRDGPPLFLSDVKDALDNMNAINQHSVHMHLFGL
jgi:hypothetical protein